jgi:dTDP-4-dehydrorhamnose 3,5-epimerase
MMRLQETPLPGVWVVEAERLGDERGWFARTFDSEEFSSRGMDPAVVQCNASFNARRGTLRGMHYQAEPHGEPKLVRCVRGAIFDVAVDLRPDSSTYCGWHGEQLSAENGRALYVPAGLAHGFQTLTDDCEVLYQMGYRYVPEAARGVRWDDPAFGIEWPTVGERTVGISDRDARTISDRDRSYPDFHP